MWRCPECEFQTDSGKTIRFHAVEEHGKRWQGHGNSLITLTAKEASDHLRWLKANTMERRHLRTAAQTCSCPECDFETDSGKTIRFHAVVEHGKRWRGNGNSLMTVTAKEASDHLRWLTADSQERRCLKTHGRRPAAETWSCPECEFQADSGRSIRNHAVAEHCKRWRGHGNPLVAILAEEAASSGKVRRLMANAKKRRHLKPPAATAHPSEPTQTWSCTECEFQADSGSTIRFHAIEKHGKHWQGHGNPLMAVTAEDAAHHLGRLVGNSKQRRRLLGGKAPAATAHPSEPAQTWSCTECEFQTDSDRTIQKHAIVKHGKRWLGQGNPLMAVTAEEAANELHRLSTNSKQRRRSMAANSALHPSTSLNRVPASAGKSPATTTQLCEPAQTWSCPECDFHADSGRSIQKHAIVEHGKRWLGQGNPLIAVTAEAAANKLHRLSTNSKQRRRLMAANSALHPSGSLDRVPASAGKSPATTTQLCEPAQTWSCPECDFHADSGRSIQKHAIVEHGKRWLGQGNPLMAVTAEAAANKLHRLLTNSKQRRRLMAANSALHPSRSLDRVPALAGKSPAITTQLCEPAQMWSCPECDFETDSGKSIRNHTIEKHGKRWRGRGNPMMAVTAKEAADKVRRLSDNSQQRLRLRTHGRKPDVPAKMWTCPECDFQAQSRTLIQKHAIVEHGKRWWGYGNQLMPITAEAAANRLRRMSTSSRRRRLMAANQQQWPPHSDPTFTGNT